MNIQENQFGPLSENVAMASLSEAWLQCLAYFFVDTQAAYHLRAKRWCTSRCQQCWSCMAMRGSQDKKNWKMLGFLFLSLGVNLGSKLITFVDALICKEAHVLCREPADSPTRGVPQLHWETCCACACALRMALRCSLEMLTSGRVKRWTSKKSQM